MEQLWSATVFSVDGVEFLWQDVRDAAEAWGDWGGLRSRARLGAALRTQAGELADSRPEESEVEEAANELRHAHGLLEAEDLDVWLGRWGLTYDDFMDAVEAGVMRRRWPAGVEALGVDPPEVGHESLETAVVAEGVVSGELHRLSVRLAGRAAVHARLLEKDGRARLERKPSIRQLDDAPEEFRRSLLSGGGVEALVRSQPEQWTRITYASLVFPREVMAREAVLSIRDDGWDVADVAKAAHVEVDEGSSVLAELAPELRDRVWPSCPGDLVGPVSTPEGWTVLLVRAKELPSAGDEELRERAEKALVARAVGLEIDKRVVWRRPA